MRIRSSDAVSLCLIAVFLAPGLSAAKGVDLSDDIRRGWFFYKDPPPAELEAEEPPPPPPAAPPQPFVPNMNDYSLEDLWNMHPDEFNPLLMSFMKKAVQSPTQANVTEYKVMEDIARRKSNAFASATLYVLRSNPGLAGMDRAVPISTPGKNAGIRTRARSIESRLSDARNDYGLVVFSSPTCHYCYEQDAILRDFVSRTGWTVKNINILERPDLAQSFGVTRTPTTLAVARRDGTHLLLSTGVISQSDLEQRLYQAIRFAEGETSPEQYALTEDEFGGDLDPFSIFDNNPLDYLKNLGGER